MLLSIYSENYDPLKSSKFEKGCWSHLSSSPGLFRLSPCSSCLCRADVGDCSRADYLGYDCGRCLTDDGAVGDGVKDCVHGVDEAQDAIALVNEREGGKSNHLDLF